MRKLEMISRKNFDTFINGKTPKKGTQGGPGGKLSGTPWYFKYLKMT